MDQTTTADTAALLTPERAAQMASVTREWLLRYANRRKPTWRLKLGHRTVRIEPTAFQAWLSGRRGR